MSSKMLQWGIVSMLAGSLLMTAGHQAEGDMSIKAFALYRSQQPGLPVSFEYPEGWELEESAGTHEPYAQVQCYGPKTMEDRLRIYLVVRAMPPKAAGGRYADVAEMVQEFQRTKLPTLRVDREGAVSVAGTAATQLDISGSLRLPWKSSKATDIPVKSQRVFFEKDGRLFELAWLGTPEASPVLADAFSRLLQTLSVGK